MRARALHAVRPCGGVCAARCATVRWGNLSNGDTLLAARSAVEAAGRVALPRARADQSARWAGGARGRGGDRDDRGECAASTTATTAPRFWRGVRLATCFDDVLRRQVRHINDDYGAEFATTELLGLVRLPYSALLTPQATRSPVSRLEPSSAHDNC